MAGLLSLSSTPFAQTTAPFDELTNTYRSVTNFNVETTRGLNISTAAVLMINTHGSTLNLYPGGAATGSPPTFPSVSWPTVNNPIAFDVYEHVDGPTTTRYAVVLGGGSHTLVLHDLTSAGAVGRITASVNLPAETGDVVVDQSNARAFVSIPGNNTVIQFALPSLRLDATFTVASQRPRFLSLDTSGETNLVYVAPELSGNNTISQNAIYDPSGSNVGADTSAVPLDLKPFLPEGLPDEDLFEITPHTFAGTPAMLVAAPVVRNVATLMMDHGRNPVTGEYWFVGTQSLNTQALTEPEQNGVFARNVLVRATSLGGSPLPFTHTETDLDGVVMPYDATYAISMPYALEFHASGWAAIAGSASDQIRILDSAGVRFGDLELPEGSIPRDLAIDSSGVLLFVYCWGTNEVRVYDLNVVVPAISGAANGVVRPVTGFLGRFDLGADPNPVRVRNGREIFYDGDNSAAGRVTCAHCHPGGGMDILGWNIQDFPHDHKELMVTQSLKSIEDTFPYHWRGERDLEAFNGAFSGLLGGTKLTETPGGELEDFKMFVFSLQAHANHREDPERIVNATLPFDEDAFIPTIDSLPDAVRGQTLMDKPDVLFDRFTCAECHGKATGSVGDPQNDDVGLIPTGLVLDVAHFRQLFHKTQDVLPISILGTSFQMPRGGFGFSQDGDAASSLDFFLRNPFDIDQQEALDLAAFVAQADQGIAPVAHRAYHVDSGTPASVITEIDTLVFPQTGTTFAADHWVSLALVGSHQLLGGATVDLRWWYNSAAARFESSDPSATFPDGNTGFQTWATLKAEAALGNASFTLIGLPPGNALRFSVDRDDDGLPDQSEAAASTDPFDPDFDLDGFPDGYEVLHGMDPLVPDMTSPDAVNPAMASIRLDHAGASYAKLVMSFTEPVTLEITATNTTTGHTTMEHRYVPRVWDTVTVQRLEPSLPGIVFTPMFPIPMIAAIPSVYAFDIKMIDLAGNFATFSTGGAVTTRDQLAPLPFPRTQVGNVPGMQPIFLSRTIENLDWVGSPGAGPVYQATADVSILYKVPELAQAYTNPPNTPNGSSDPNEQQVVIAQVLHFDSSAGTWSVLPMAGPAFHVTAPAGRLFSQVFVRADPTMTFPSPAAAALDFDAATNPHFLLSTTSGVSGQVTFDFTLSAPVPLGDQIKLNIIGVLERDLRDSPPTNEFWAGSLGTYNMPVTAEENRGIAAP